MRKHPYNFSARSRAAMADAIEAIGHQRGYDHRRFPFCFNVKLWDGWNDGAATLNKLEGAEWELRPEWDDAWESYAEEHSEGLFERVRDSMYWSMVDSYSTYPGDDCGEWQFEFAGRQGGWLCLVSGPGFDFRNRHLDDIVSEVRGSDPYERFTWDECKRLYRALVCMAHDFRRDAITAETRYQLAFIRSEWEQEREARIRELWGESCDARHESWRLLAELREQAGTLPPYVESAARDRADGRLRFGRGSRAAMWELLGDELTLADVGVATPAEPIA